VSGRSVERKTSKQIEIFYGVRKLFAMVIGVKTEIVQSIILIVHICASLLIAFVGSVLFFWPRKYKSVTSDVILITGGGKGIGRLIAVEFAKRKPKQVIFYLSDYDKFNKCCLSLTLQSF